MTWFTFRVMLTIPSRITQLIERLESGPLTPPEVSRLLALQALDLAKLGEDFVRQICAAEEHNTEEFRQFLERA